MFCRPCLSTVFALCVFSAAAAEHGGFVTRVWQPQDGLAAASVQSITQTPDHYLWIGTTRGLERFNGSSFTTFNRDNTPVMSEESIFCLLADSAGNLWVGTDGGGLLRYRAGVFKAYRQADGITNEFIRAVIEDRDHRLLVGTDSGVFVLRGERFVRLDGTKGFPEIAAHAILADKRGHVWIGGSALYYSAEERWIRASLDGGSAQNRIKSLLEDKAGNIWVGTTSGAQRSSPVSSAEPAQFVRVPEVNATVRVLSNGVDGSVWAGTIGRGVLRPTQPQRQDFPALDSVPAAPSSPSLPIRSAISG